MIEVVKLHGNSMSRTALCDKHKADALFYHSRVCVVPKSAAAAATAPPPRGRCSRVRCSHCSRYCAPILYSALPLNMLLCYNQKQMCNKWGPIPCGRWNHWSLQPLLTAAAARRPLQPLKPSLRPLQPLYYRVANPVRRHGRSNPRGLPAAPLSNFSGLA